MRLVAQQYSFVPQCIVVPAGMPVTFRGTATDAIHGFVVGTTNANTMLIPGFVSTFTTTFPKTGEQLMPCHEYCGTGHEAMWARVQVLPRGRVPGQGARRGKAELCSSLGSSSSPTSGSPSSPSSARSCSASGRCTSAARCAAWVNNPEHYYRSVTAHGTVMAYVLPTLVAMGFGYAITELALKRPLIGVRWAWAGFWLVDRAAPCSAAATMALGKASVLYTFYPPMIASPFYYLGVVLVVVGSWIWVALMSINLRAWKKENPGATVPLAMFGNVAGAYLWAWTSVGAAVEVLVLILPASLGLTDTINAGLARVLFSWTLHAIVYFWLMPAYIAFYTIVPRAIGGRLYSDTMGRVAFVLFLVFSMPIGIHHLFADPQVGAGFKFVHAAMTAMVSVPTLLTVFTIVASVEIAGRLRGGKGAVRLGQGAAVGQPDDAGGDVLVRHARLRRRRRHHQHELPAQRDDPQHAVGHRALPPDLRRRDRHHVLHGRLRAVAAAHAAARRCRAASIKLQLWLWFVGMLVLSLPWHLVGLLGMPRRMAYYDYTPPGTAAAGLDGHRVDVRRPDAGGRRRCSSSASSRRARRRRAPSRRAFTFSRTAHPGGAHAGRAERLRPLGRDDDRR